MKFLSIVIPAFNSQNTVGKLLDSIKTSKKIDNQDIEIIVVDDASLDKTLQIVAGFLEYFKFNLKLIKLKSNSGPAGARNIGVKYAKGKIILFLDADVELFPNTIYEVINSFKTDPDLYALTGVWVKEQKSRKFFSKFKALRDWSYWINERDPKNYYYLFSTRVAAIERKLFLRLGGFNTTYKAALIEDIELTYRIARRYAVVFNPRVRVRHEFEDFAAIAKKYFWRSYFWSKLYRERKKFDPVATTGKEAVTTLSAGLLVILVFAYFGVRIMNYELRIMNFSLSFLILASLFMILIIHFWGVRKFLIFAGSEYGFVFALKSFFTGIVLYLIILAGAVYSLVF